MPNDMIWLPKERVLAVHFLDRNRWKAGEVLCLTPVEYSRGRTNITEDPQKVTCIACGDLLIERGHVIRGKRPQPKMF